LLNLYPFFFLENVKSKELGYKQKINLVIILKKKGSWMIGAAQKSWVTSKKSIS
jgi:hypothetical protein